MSVLFCALVSTVDAHQAGECDRTYNGEQSASQSTPVPQYFPISLMMTVQHGEEISAVESVVFFNNKISVKTRLYMTEILLQFSLT